MNFEDIDEIQIQEGDVQEIVDLNNNVIWEKVTNYKLLIDDKKDLFILHDEQNIYAYCPCYITYHNNIDQAELTFCLASDHGNYHIVADNIFSWPGLTFLSWNLCSDGTGTIYIPKSTFYIKNKVNVIDLYAQWTGSEATCPITYYENYTRVGSKDEQVRYDFAEYNSAYLIKNVNDSKISFDRTGYTFVNWNTRINNSGEIYKAGNKIIVLVDTLRIDLHAIWNPNSYSVKFIKTVGEGQMNGQLFKYDVSQQLTYNIFSRTGYNFNGWSILQNAEPKYEDGEIVKNLTTINNYVVNLYTCWTPIEYKITYELNGGKHSGNPTTYNIESDRIIFNNPTKTGYTGSFNPGSIVKGSIGDKTIVASYIPIWYEITYELNGGLHEGNPVRYNIESDRIIFNNPTKTGYTGRFSPNSISTGSTGNKNIVAIYTANTYVITFDANGGSVTPQTKTVTYDSTYGDLPNAAFDGHIFEGWYTDSINGNKIEKDTKVTIVNNLTLYAHWSLAKIDDMLCIMDRYHKTRDVFDTVYSEDYATEYKSNGGSGWGLIGIYVTINGVLTPNSIHEMNMQQNPKVFDDGLTVSFGEVFTVKTSKYSEDTCTCRLFTITSNGSTYLAGTWTNYLHG